MDGQHELHGRAKLNSVFSQELFVFRCDISASQISSAMSSYPRLRSLEVLLNENDISNLSRQLHNRFRHDRDKQAIFPHVETLIADMQSGVIPGHPLASVHLLSALKDMSEFETANRFWQWLRTCDEQYTDARVYGAMIETLAYQGEPLSELEKLYEEAFERYSNRRSETAKETGATRIMLLQGIITARVLNGEWRSAYEAFDLILRLYPTATPPRVYELFIYERPIKEAFIVFLMACRAGTPPKSGVLTPMLKGVWQKHKDATAMLRLVWAYVGAGGTVTHHHLNMIIKAILMSYPEKPKDDTHQALIDHDAGFKQILSYVRDCVSAFRALGVELAPATFNTLIACGGKLKRGELVLGGLKDMMSMGMAPDSVTYRTLVLAAGDLGDVKQLEEAWQMLDAAREEDYIASGGDNSPTPIPSRGWDMKDFKTLIDGCWLLNHADYARGRRYSGSRDASPLLPTNPI
ncbi:hypothetical protein DFH27DRAFT_592305 [Peziza echinospora]|nr:hypothetical protein DFH27DRAFT_592305 [Peziza echinospora]